MQQWAEESAFGGVRKYGGNSDGHNWDSFEDGALWVSGNHFNYDMALSHSPYLLSVKLRGEYELEQMAAPTQAAKDSPTSGALGSVAMFGAAGPPEGADDAAAARAARAAAAARSRLSKAARGDGEGGARAPPPPPREI